jgi:hypothetical protein
MTASISFTPGEIEQDIKRRNKLGRHKLQSVMRNIS